MPRSERTDEPETLKRLGFGVKGLGGGSYYRANFNNVGGDEGGRGLKLGSRYR